MVSMKEIAKQCYVSVATVSKALKVRFVFKALADELGRYPISEAVLNM